MSSYLSEPCLFLCKLRYQTHIQFSFLVSALLVATSAWAESVLIDDFDDGNLDGWEHLDSTRGQPYGPATFSAASKAFQLQGGGIIRKDVPGGGFLGSIWEASSDEQYSEGFVRAKVRANTEGSTAALFLRMSGGLQSHMDGYLFFGTTAANGNQGQGGLLINRIENTDTAEAWFLDSDFASGDDWYLEAGAVEDRITLKAWAAGAPEPDAPQIVVFDPLFDEGSLGVLTNIHLRPFGGPAVVNATFDDIYFTFPGQTGDFNNDGNLGPHDLDSLMRHMNGDRSLYFDVTNDMLLDEDDFGHWITKLRNTWFGDSNLDGEFNTTDLVNVFQAGKFEKDLVASWSEGDWNADSVFDTGDLVKAFQDGGFEKGPRVGANAVPEPTSVVMLMLGWIAIATQHRARRRF